jgi:DNA-binding NarL/FixJ family response regulator
MREMNGLEATRKIRKILPKTEVLILSVHYSDQLLREVVDTGARGYVLKSDASTDLLTAVGSRELQRSSFSCFVSSSPEANTHTSRSRFYGPWPHAVPTALREANSKVVRLVIPARVA